MSWIYVHDTEDEEGNREQWKFFYKRFNVREMNAYIEAIGNLSQPNDEGVHDPISVMIDMAEMSIRRTERNGVPYDVAYEQWPHDILDEATSNHTTFRNLVERASQAAA